MRKPYIKLEQTSRTETRGYAQIELDDGPEAFLRAKTYSNGSPKVYAKRAEAKMVFGGLEPEVSDVDIASETSYYAEAIAYFNSNSYFHASEAITKYTVQNLETLDDSWQRTITLAIDPAFNIWYEVED